MSRNNVNSEFSSPNKFIELFDVSPHNYVGDALKVYRVNALESGLEPIDPSSIIIPAVGIIPAQHIAVGASSNPPILEDSGILAFSTVNDRTIDMNNNSLGNSIINYNAVQDTLKIVTANTTGLTLANTSSQTMTLVSVQPINITSISGAVNLTTGTEILCTENGNSNFTRLDSNSFHVEHINGTILDVNGSNISLMGINVNTNNINNVIEINALVDNNLTITNTGSLLPQSIILQNQNVDSGSKIQMDCEFGTIENNSSGFFVNDVSGLSSGYIAGNKIKLECSNNSVGIDTTDIKISTLSHVYRQDANGHFFDDATRIIGSNIADLTGISGVVGSDLIISSNSPNKIQINSMNFGNQTFNNFTDLIFDTSIANANITATNDLEIRAQGSVNLINPIGGADITFSILGDNGAKGLSFITDVTSMGGINTYTLPIADPVTANEILTCTSGGVMSWIPNKPMNTIIKIGGGTLALSSTTNTRYCNEGFSNLVASGSNNSSTVTSIFYMVAANIQQYTGYTSKFRLSLIVMTNGTAPAATLTAGLYPISSSLGNTGQMIPTLGTVVTNSTAVIATPALNTRTHAESLLFDTSTVPDGAYTLGIVNDLTTASLCAISVDLELIYE